MINRDNNSPSEEMYNLALSINNLNETNHLYALTEKLANFIGADHVFIGRFKNLETRVKTQAYFGKGQRQDNFEYDLKGTPCSDLTSREACYIEKDIAKLYPEDNLLIKMNIASYYGVLLRGQHEKNLGILVALFEQPTKTFKFLRESFQLFAVRASVELERVIAVNHLKEKIKELQEKNERLQIAQQIYDFSSDGIIVTDANNFIVYVNSALERMSGYRESELRGKNPRILNSGIMDTLFYEKLWGNLHGKGYWQGEITNRHKNGNTYPVLTALSVIPNEQEQPKYYIAIHRDVSKEKEAQQLISYQATHDQLTGLINRYEFNAQLERQLSHIKRHNEVSALFLLDIDHFKTINDNMGTIVGDDLLNQIAKRIKTHLREEDLFARIGDDEFVIFSVFQIIDNIESLANKILSFFREPFKLNTGGVLSITASIGISLYGQDADDTNSLFSCADQALRVAKHNGRYQYSFFSDHLRIKAKRVLQVRQRLIDALNDDVIEPYFQPIVNIKTKRICHFESLARWNDSELGPVSPSEFIPIAEHNGLIQQLGFQVSSKAVQQLARFNQELKHPVGLSINLSPQELVNAAADIDFAAQLANESGLPPELISIELTESLMVTSPDLAQNYLKKLKSKGFKLSMDDFGTGYSSLAYLKLFPFDTLKIDRSFVKDLASDESDFNLVKTIIDMASNFRMQTIAEGVETKEQLERLQELGCDYAQGYLFSPALPFEEMMSYFNKHQKSIEVS